MMIILLIIIACIVTMIQVIVRKFPGSHPLPGLKNFAGSCGSGAYSFPLPYTIRMGEYARVGVLVDLLPRP